MTVREVFGAVVTVGAMVAVFTLNEPVGALAEPIYVFAVAVGVAVFGAVNTLGSAHADQFRALPGWATLGVTVTLAAVLIVLERSVTVLPRGTMVVGMIGFFGAGLCRDLVRTVRQAA